MGCLFERKLGVFYTNLIWRTRLGSKQRCGGLDQKGARVVNVEIMMNQNNRYYNRSSLEQGLHGISGLASTTTNHPNKIRKS
jgi:hypothetical protein